MTRTVPFSRNRDTIYDFLSRAKRFHCTITSLHEIDVTELSVSLARCRAAGRPVSFLAAFVKATGMTIARYPRLNHHLFHGLWRKVVVDFEEIVCTLIVLRKDAGELSLLPVNIDRPHERSVEDITDLIAHHRRSPLESLPQFQGIQKMKKLPRPAMHVFSFLCRSNPRFYRKFFGTYGVSPLLMEDDDGVIEGRPGAPTGAFANTCTAFIPAAVADHPRVVDGAVVVRKMLTTLMALDHYLVDGHDGFLAVRHLDKLLGEPARLGLGEASEG
jgi:hypothetical protein